MASPACRKERYVKKVLPLLLALALLLSVAGCRRTEEQQQPNEPSPPAVDDEPDSDPQPEPEPELQEKTVFTTYDSEKGEPLVNVSLTVPYPSGSQAAAQIAAFYDGWLEDMDYYCGVTLSESAAQAMALAQQNGGVFQPYTVESSYEVKRDDSAVYSVVRGQYENLGGPHPSYSMLAETFSAENVGRMSIYDLFPDLSVEETSDLVESLVLPLARQRADAEPDLYFAEYETLLMQTFDPLCFALTAEGLTLFWQTYAIGPFVSGVQQFDIPYADFEGQIDPQWLP